MNYFNPLTKDIIIGSIYNYSTKDVAPWINTIRAVDFYGEVIVINYGCPVETIEFLKKRGVKVYDSQLEGLHVVVKRFWDMYQILKDYPLCDYRCVFATDVKDVIFQKNPSERFLHSGYDEPGILASTENIYYRDETWGDDNLKKCYPHLYESFKHNIIYNAGTMAGEIQLMIDLFLHIYHLSLVGTMFDPQPDQAAYNILLQTRPFLYNTYFTEDRDAWVANLGTTLSDRDRKKNAQFLLDPPPVIRDHVVFNNDGAIYSIVHQYDRVSGLKEFIQDKFGNLD